jgi:hypothetical protein
MIVLERSTPREVLELTRQANGEFADIDSQKAQRHCPFELTEFMSQKVAEGTNGVNKTDLRWRNGDSP